MTAPAPTARPTPNPTIVPIDHPGWEAAEIRALDYDRRRAVRNPDQTTTVFGNHADYVVRAEHGGYSCTCPAHGPCWHTALAQPLCANCRTDRAAVGYEHCRGCAAVLAERAGAALPALVQLAESTPDEIAYSEALKAQTMASLLDGEDELARRRALRAVESRDEAAEANARAMAAHRFVDGSPTLISTGPIW